MILWHDWKFLICSNYQNNSKQKSKMSIHFFQLQYRFCEFLLLTFDFTRTSHIKRLVCKRSIIRLLRELIQYNWCKFGENCILYDERVPFINDVSCSLVYESLFCWPSTWLLHATVRTQIRQKDDNVVWWI